MQLLNVTVKNLNRRKGRMVLLIAGLTIGVATVVALMTVTEMMQADITGKLDEYGANILIVPMANDLSVSYGGVTVASAAYNVGELVLSDLDRIQTIKNATNISVVAPKLLGVTALQGHTVLIAGVRFPDELLLKQWWQIDGDEPAAPNDALVGQRLAKTLDLHPGTTLEIDGHPFRVTGVLAENGSQDDDILFIDLAAAQQIMDKPQSITLVEVAALCTECPVEDMVEQISVVLPQARVTALRQAVTLRMKTATQLGQFALTVSGVVIVIGALVVLTTMLSTVSERRHEIGLFRALGFRKRHIAQIILSEAAVVSLAGGILGWGLGLVSAMVLSSRLVNVTAPVSLNLSLALGAVAGALVVGVVASIYPAVQASNMDPTTALRSL